MRVLLLFCDMLRANKLSLINSKIQRKSPVDNLLLELGGTVYTRCFTPAPDTPRSLACLYTGLSPKYNGCVKRIHWPRYFLKDDVKTIFDQFEEAGVSIFSYISEAEIKTGMLPERARASVKNYGSLSKLLTDKKNILKADRSFTFINLQDYHIAVDELKGSSLADKVGQEQLVKVIKKIFDQIPENNFDEIFVISDHGCKFANERKSAKELDFINDDRAQTVLFHSKMIKQNIEKNDGITSVCEIANMLLHPFSLKLTQQSTFKHNSEFGKYIVVEDYAFGKNSVTTVPSLWRVITEHFSYYEDLDQKKLKLENNSQLSKSLAEAVCEEILLEEAQFYYSEKKENYVLGYYNDLARSDKRRTFSDGTKLPGKFYVLFNLFLVACSRVKSVFL